MGSTTDFYGEEDLECCLRCGKRVGLQGVAVTIGTKTFHLFYLCDECGRINIDELLKMIRWYKEKGTTCIGTAKP
jgi:hypothetical protein